jgi:hypothetical protein
MVMFKSIKSSPVFNLWINKIAVIALIFLVSIVGFGRLDSIFRVELNHQISPEQFHLSIIAGKYNEVEKALARGIDPNTRDEGHRTALYVAEASGNTDIARLLVEHGAKTEINDPSGIEYRTGLILNDSMKRYLEVVDKETISKSHQIPAS